jgi:hypothetical protein
MNEIIVRFPEEAIKLKEKIMSIQIIPVVDDHTNIKGCEQLKTIKLYKKEFEELLEPARKDLRKPLDDFLSLKKDACDQIDEKIKNQTDYIGSFGQEIIRKENERKALELTMQNELKGETKEFQPITEARAHSEFVKSKVSEKPDAHITDLVVYAQTLLSSGDLTTFRLVFDKPNIVQVNKQCKRDGIDGREKSFPGLSVTMVPDVKQR